MTQYGGFGGLNNRDSFPAAGVCSEKGVKICYNDIGWDAELYTSEERKNPSSANGGT